MAYYLDPSAAVKLVLAEAGSGALARWAAEHQDTIVSSDLLRTELLRATRRGAPHRLPRARDVLDALVLLTLPTSTFERAAELDPDKLRSLDALHLAAALALGDELDALVTYDTRMTAGAQRLGVRVVAPR
jgi:predicted nucleic acid-binding protein